MSPAAGLLCLCIFAAPGQVAGESPPAPALPAPAVSSPASPPHVPPAAPVLPGGEGAPLSRRLDPAPGSGSHQLFTEANRLFNAARSEADVRSAVEAYRALLARGIRNGRLYYNLASAHLRLREIGPAILNLLRARLYLPGEARAAATLAHARRQVPDEFPDKGEGKALEALFFWHHGTSLSGRVWTALAAHALFWVLLAARAFRRLPFHRTAMAACLLVGAGAGGSAAVETWLNRGQEAVIVAPEVEVRSGNGAGYPLVFSRPIHSGVEVRVLETRGNWKLLAFPNQVRGWVLSSTVEEVAGDGLVSGAP